MPIIRTGLEDDDVIEIMANPNGEIWFDRLSCGVERTGMVFSETQIETIIGTIAHWHGVVVHREAPRLRAELPLDGSRFQGLLRPVSPPTFVIRKHLKQVISLDEQVAAGTLTPAQAATLHAAINARNNIAIVGGTLSGKTVLANTVIDAMVQAFGESLRLVLIEDTYELRCTECRAFTHERYGQYTAAGARRAATASGSDHRRRSARRGSVGSFEELEHRPSWRCHHRARRHCTTGHGSSGSVD